MKIYKHYSRIFLDYKIKSQDFINIHLNNENWHIKEYWSIFIGINPKIWEIENLYYDGHTSKGITILGLTVGKTYSYESKKKEDWI